ncbi:uncharacterized protein PV09_00010 [Verruconis gallopava]|uniref:Swi5-domain-containing protein n=1 Tax=Verruconis gallopava TaxID=253628 RepID=A0A0D1Y1Z9_9PEZI|nr:uncharacterized protein PV09_00010 [Verruconis gallopava]KIW09061.1 hypothetical protein PV09_00010 [Verruconis gallopava]
MPTSRSEQRVGDPVSGETAYTRKDDGDASNSDASIATKDAGQRALEGHVENCLPPTSKSTQSTATSFRNAERTTTMRRTSQPPRQAMSAEPSEPGSEPGADAVETGGLDSSRSSAVVEPTAEHRRLQLLQSKQVKLARTLSQLDHRRSMLLLQLLSTLPAHATRDLSISPCIDDKYTPSIYAHTVPALRSISEEDKDLLVAHASRIIKQHIRKLHEYNEVRDIAQGLIGMIADRRGMRVVDVQAEFGIGCGD